ncbi:MAG: DUF1343 domain-containing protein [Planctomycetota bacterium]
MRLGIDVLQAESFDRLAGQRVAILTNRTGRASDGARTIDLLLEAPEVEVVRLLSPEHGLTTEFEGKVGDAVDAPTGLPIFSLYGESRRPTEAMLEGLDTVVFDVQDIGARFYTYITTLGYLMEECAPLGVRVMVLDRPNPIAFLGVDGPSADPDRLDFIAYRSIPVTHGLTMGELATLFNAEYDLGCDLEVVEMSDWYRNDEWAETGLRWIDPSPNIRNPEQAVLYPGIGLLEATPISVGRGTDTPFERLGAPWIDELRLARALNRWALPGVRFVPVRFTPDASVHRGVECGGVHIELTDRHSLRSVRTGLTIAWELEQLFGAHFDETRLMRLLKSHRVLVLWERRGPIGLEAAWEASATRFAELARRYWRYPVDVSR